MPVHDWSRVPANVFLHFRLCWLVSIRTLINRMLPADWYALMVPDAFDPDADPAHPVVGRRAIAVFDKSARRKAVIDVPPPETKERAEDHERYARRAAGQLVQSVSLLVIDVFPQIGGSSRRVTEAIWNAVSPTEFMLPPERPLTAVAFSAQRPVSAFVEPLSLGDSLPDMPLFIGPDVYVSAPLEGPYMDAFDGVPRHFRDAITAPGEGGAPNGA